MFNEKLKKINTSIRNQSPFYNRRGLQNISIKYKFTDSPNTLNKAFDILFEEAMKVSHIDFNLTSRDN